MRLYGSLKELVQIVFREDTFEISLDANSSTAYTANRSIQAPPGDQASILVGESNTQTLTNKSMSGASNTFTSISLTTSVTDILPTANGGTGQNSTAVFPTSGTLITRDSTDQGANRLNNKDLDDSSVAFVDNADTTKKLKFQCSGITSGITRTLTIQDSDGTIAYTASPTFTGTATAPTFKATTSIVLEDPGAGTNTITLQAPTLSGNYTLTLPVDDGGSGQVLTTDGTGGLSWSSVASGLSNSINDIQNLSLATSVASNILTIALKDISGSDPSGGSSVKIGFRSSTSTTGTYSVASITAALSIDVSSGATLGHVSGAPEYIYVYALDNAGTVELAVSSTLFDTGSIQSTTAMSSSADSANVLYSTTARTNKAIRLIGRLQSTQTTAGTWAANASEISSGDSFALQQTPMGMPNQIATQQGHYQYVHGTSYANGNAPTVTTTAGGTVVKRAVFIPYQMQDGAWRMTFNIVVYHTASSSLTVSVNGITFKNTTDYFQCVAFNMGNVTSYTMFCNPGSDDMLLDAGTAGGRSDLSGDVELDSKPTWAY